MAVEYPTFLHELGEQLAKVLDRRLAAWGVTPDEASDAAFEAVEWVRQAWGGQEVYLPKAEYIELASRDREIYEKFLANHTYLQLNREFDLSEQWIRQIIRAARLARRQQAFQTPLPFEPGAEPVAVAKAS